MIAKPKKSVFDGALAVITEKGNLPYLQVGGKEIKAIYDYYDVNTATPWEEVPQHLQRRIFKKKPSDKDPISFEIIPVLKEFYHKYDAPAIFDKYMTETPCNGCDGKRLTPLSQHVYFDEKTITHFTEMTVKQLHQAINNTKDGKIKDFNKKIFDPIFKEINERLKFLLDIGLEYLTLGRSATTLSGGELQRIRLSSQIGNGLEGCLYILDEPSIGLHQADNKKLITTLRKLRDKNNTIIIIEHDEETMLAADYLIDVGPFAGTKGGQIVFAGKPEELFQKTKQKSFTRQFLLGEKSIAVPTKRRDPKMWMSINRINKNNLHDISCQIPLQILTVLVGVSGSGKSTLVEVLIAAIANSIDRKKNQKTTESTPREYKSIKRINNISAIIEINQKPIGRSSRSNPATYTKIWQFIREVYTEQKGAKVKGYNKSFFSFNVKGGRCEHCQGNGTITVDMQIFSNVDVICEYCNGKRFHSNILDVYYRDKNIYDVLEMTVNEAHDFFVDYPPIHQILSMLVEIGLGYITLGQSSSTLSGGEAQRIKLATELCKKSSKLTEGQILYFLDEPTTGLHFDDIAKLLFALKSLVKKGHTVVVIEHNLDVIKVADHLIELGPKGGEEGGKIIATGSPEELILQKTSTAKELKNYLLRQKKRESKSDKTIELINDMIGDSKKDNHSKKNDAEIFIKGLRKNNLRNISLTLPKQKLITFTGVSGSGKTSLAFGTLFTEGQRKYLESLSTYARRFLGQNSRVDVDEISGLSPTIAVNQKYGSHNPRSTVATQTEIYDSLRILYANIGKKKCQVCQDFLSMHNVDSASREILRNFPNEVVVITAPLYIDHSSFYSICFLENNPEKILQYKDFFNEQGYVRIAVNEKIYRLVEFEKDQLPKKIDSISLVIDRVSIETKNKNRISEAITKAYNVSKNMALVLHEKKSFFYSSYWHCYEDKVILLEEPTAKHFSFNHPLGSCDECLGLGQTIQATESLVILDKSKPFLGGALVQPLHRFFNHTLSYYGRILKKKCTNKAILYSIPYENLSPEDKKFLLYGKKSKQKKIAKQPSKNWMGALPMIEKLVRNKEESSLGLKLAKVTKMSICQKCQGGRLKPNILSMTIDDYNIYELTLKSISFLEIFFKKLLIQLDPKEKKIAAEAIAEVSFRLSQMETLGIGYLTLNRTMATLSGGEVQRIRLSTQIGNQLKDIIYVLDEPTIGLHEHDTQKLLLAIKRLQKNGNTVIMVEHDGNIIKQSDIVVDIGTGAGEQGGNIVYNGINKPKLLKQTSIYPYLYGEKKNQNNLYRDLRDSFDIKKDPHLSCDGIVKNNIKNIEAIIPTGKLVGFSGVSGSGKSSLLLHWLVPELKLKNKQIKYIKGNKKQSKLPFDSIETIDQSPISTSSRTTPITYLDIFNRIRETFAKTPYAKQKGFSPGHFSFNSYLGNCPQCKGTGKEVIEMHFINNIDLVCLVCAGKRYQMNVLDVYYKGKNIDNILNMDFVTAYDFFYEDRVIRDKMEFILDSGLGYIKLGLTLDKLSGGELQRIKLAKELTLNISQKILYVLDEPTTGLHFADVEKLVKILDNLIGKGHTIFVIEHNVEFLRNCDYIIDMGPEGGDAGGSIIAAGNIEEIKKQKEGETWKVFERKCD